MLVLGNNNTKRKIKRLTHRHSWKLVFNCTYISHFEFIVPRLTHCTAMCVVTHTGHFFFVIWYSTNFTEVILVLIFQDSYLFLIFPLLHYCFFKKYWGAYVFYVCCCGLPFTSMPESHNSNENWHATAFGRTKGHKKSTIAWIVVPVKKATTRFDCTLQSTLFPSQFVWMV